MNVATMSDDGDYVPYSWVNVSALALNLSLECTRHDKDAMNSLSFSFLQGKKFSLSSWRMMAKDQLKIEGLAVGLADLFSSRHNCKTWIFLMSYDVDSLRVIIAISSCASPREIK